MIKVSINSQMSGAPDIEMFMKSSLRLLVCVQVFTLHHLIACYNQLQATRKHTSKSNVKVKLLPIRNQSYDLGV